MIRIHKVSCTHTRSFWTEGLPP